MFLTCIVSIVDSSKSITITTSLVIWNKHYEPFTSWNDVQCDLSPFWSRFTLCSITSV